MSKLGNWRRGIAMLSASLFWLGVAQSVAWCQHRSKASQTIVQVGDYVVTVKDLEKRIQGYPEGYMSSRESKRRLVESLITPKLFALAARDANMKAYESPNAKERAREIVLAYAYFRRQVNPRFSEEEARKYFQANKEKYGAFVLSRDHIIELLRDQALTEANQWLMEKWKVQKKEDVLKNLDLKIAKDPSLVLAQIGPRAVTVADLQELASRYEGQKSFTSASTEKTFLLDVILLERLYALEAETSGLANDPDVQKMLASYEEQLLAAKYAQSIEGKTTIEAARRYYQTHQDEFKQSSQIRVSQIVIKTLEEAQAAKARLDKGDPFEEVAKSFSIERASAVRGGSLGWVRKGALQSEVEKVAFQLKPGQMSKPIKTSDGYSIIQVEDRLEGVTNSFDDVAPDILLRLKTRATEEERARLMKIYNVTINEMLL